MSKFIPQNFNDFLALVLIVLIVTLWIVQGASKVILREDVNGALVVIFTLIIQHYYRKAPSEKH